MVKNRDELELLLACRDPIFDREFVLFAESDDVDSFTPATNDYSVSFAIDRVVAMGILPAPRIPLPPVGARVETIELGGKPSPACRYGVGVVRTLQWDWIFRCCRIGVKFDQPTGGWCGYPFLGTLTFQWAVHVIGDGEQAFSEMTPDQIEVLHEVRRRQFWREIDPACGLQDPSTVVETFE